MEPGEEQSLFPARVVPGISFHMYISHAPCSPPSQKDVSGGEQQHSSPPPPLFTKQGGDASIFPLGGTSDLPAMAPRPRPGRDETNKRAREECEESPNSVGGSSGSKRPKVNADDADNIIIQRTGAKSVHFIASEVVSYLVISMRSASTLITLSCHRSGCAPPIKGDRCTPD